MEYVISVYYVVFFCLYQKHIGGVWMQIYITYRLCSRTSLNAVGVCHFEINRIELEKHNRVEETHCTSHHPPPQCIVGGALGKYTNDIQTIHAIHDFFLRFYVDFFNYFL